jgi:hypothetical protein
MCTGTERRPIVEFAIENAQILKKREMRQTKIRDAPGEKDAAARGDDEMPTMPTSTDAAAPASAAEAKGKKRKRKQKDKGKKKASYVQNLYCCRIPRLQSFRDDYYWRHKPAAFE